MDRHNRATVLICIIEQATNTLLVRTSLPLFNSFCARPTIAISCNVSILKCTTMHGNAKDCIRICIILQPTNTLVVRASLPLSNSHQCNEILDANAYNILQCIQLVYSKAKKVICISMQCTVVLTTSQIS